MLFAPPPKKKAQGFKVTVANMATRTYVCLYQQSVIWTRFLKKRLKSEKMLSLENK